mmetsp:Transcript_64232/g.186227  ORF Transcript_64232/g.186227 Transcript_64232/m.186227 type:complete len:224 (+) Transcript_64232:1415-2086(+)
MELMFLYEVVPVAVLQGGLLVCAHERGLGVHPRWPHLALDHLDYEFVNLGQADDIVPIVVEAAPQLLQVRRLDEAILFHVRIEGHAQLNELVVARGHRCASDLRVCAPLVVRIANGPLLPTAIGGRLAVAGFDERPTLVAVVHHLAEHPPSFPGVEQVSRRHAARHEGGHTIVLHLHGLVHIIDEGESRVRRPALDLDRGRHCAQLHRDRSAGPEVKLDLRLD